MTSFLDDPLREEKFTKMKGLVYKYPGRILLELNNICSVYCQFCTRKRETFKKEKWELNKREVKKILDFVKENKEIREIVISGGDPLMSPTLLMDILEKIEQLEQIKIIRIHTRMPIVSPKKINKKIFNFIKKYKKIIYVSIHCNSVEEIKNEGVEIFNKFKNSGAILYSQSVFLRGINDSADKLQKLFEKLLELGVRPYCIYRCDLVVGLEKFVVPLEKEKKIMIGLRKRLSGLACPIYVIDGEIKRKFVDFSGNQCEIDG